MMSDRKEEPDFGGFAIPVKCLHSAGAAAGGFGVLSHYLTAKKVGDALLCDVGVNEGIILIVIQFGSDADVLVFPRENHDVGCVAEITHIIVTSAHSRMNDVVVERVVKMQPFGDFYHCPWRQAC